MAAVVEDRKQRVSISALWNGTGTAPAGSVVTASSPGGSVLAIEITGTFTATVQFEGTIDETTWFALTGIPAAGGAGVTSATAAGRWFFQYSGLRAARVRASAYTSGTPVVTMNVGAGGAAGSVAGGAGSSTVVLSPTAALADATANPTIAQIQTFPMVWNGTTWDRWKDMAAANGLTTFTGVPAVAPVYLDTTGTPSVRRGVTAASTTGGITGIQVPGSGNLVWDGTSFRPQTSNVRGDTITVSGGLTPSAPTCTFTRPANTTAYTIGDEVGTASTAPTTVSVARFNGGSGIILGAQVVYSSYAATTPQLVVALFSATVTLAGDNAQLNLSDGDAALCIGIIPLSAAQSGQYSAGTPVAAGNTIFSGAPTAPIEFTAGGSQQTIYAAIFTLNAFTPIANSETLILTLRVEQN